MTIGVLLTVAAGGCLNAFELPPGTPHMSGTWKGTAANATLTVKVGSVQECSGFCLSDTGPINGGSYSDATLNVHGSILAGGSYIVNPCYSCATPQTDITDWSIAMHPTVSDTAGATTASFEFDGRFANARTVVGTVYFYGATGDSVAITLVKQ
jgi:hypothetical protein